MSTRLYWIKDCYINLDQITFVPRVEFEEDLDEAGADEPQSGYIISVYTTGISLPFAFRFDTKEEAERERNSLVGAAGTAPRP